MNKRRRIAWVMHSVYNVKFFLVPHLKMLSNYYDVTLYLKNDAPDILLQLDLPVRVIEVPIERRVHIYSDLKALWCLWRSLRKEKPELVHSTTAKGGLLGMLAAFFSGIPIRIHTFQGEVWPHYQGLKRLLFKGLDSLVAKLATHITVVSQSELDFLRAHRVLGETQGRVFGAGSIGGVDLKRFHPVPTVREARRRELGYSEGDCVLLYLGRLQADKGLDVLCEAVTLVSKDTSLASIQMLVVGPDEDDLAAGLQHDLEERISIYPYTDAPESFIAAADILVLPSFREGFGMVLIEAAAMGVPAIGSRIHGISCAVVDGKTGLLFDVGNSRQLAEAIKRLGNNQALRETLGNNGRLRVMKEFDQAFILEEIKQFYFECLPPAQSIR